MRVTSLLPLPVRQLRSPKLRTWLGLAALCMAATAQAHTGEGDPGSFFSGFLHPITGFDHLLAMVAVGIWGAALGRPLIFALPVAFPLLMVAGGVLGITKVPLPYVETGIAISVVVLGLAIALAWRAPLAAALSIVAFFGVFHGYAHGAELPDAAQPAAYVLGFVLCTGLLHMLGIALGTIAFLPRGAQILRATGAAIALAGGWILLGMPGAA
jgi:urease accessory protein